MSHSIRRLAVAIILGSAAVGAGAAVAGIGLGQANHAPERQAAPATTRSGMRQIGLDVGPYGCSVQRRVDVYGDVVVERVCQ